MYSFCVRASLGMFLWSSLDLEQRLVKIASVYKSLDLLITLIFVVVVVFLCVFILVLLFILVIIVITK